MRRHPQGWTAVLLIGWAGCFLPCFHASAATDWLSDATPPARALGDFEMAALREELSDPMAIEPLPSQPRRTRSAWALEGPLLGREVI